MKKSLNLLLAFALVFSMFSTAVFAADSQSAAQKLVNAGIIKGSNSGDLMENETWKRQDVTVIIARLLGVEEEAKNTPKNHSFADVTDPYYDGFITYAYQNGYFTGHSEVRFGYGEEITVKQFAAVMLRVLGYDVAWDEVEEVAVEVGLVPAGTDFEEAATRGEYFVIIDTTLQTETADGEILGVALGLPGYAPEAPEVAVKAVGAKKIEVAFNKAVNKEQAKITVKKGNNTTNIDKITWSDDNKTATIHTAAKLTQGEYTVTVSGVAESDYVLTLAAEDEKVAKVEITNDKAPLENNDAEAIFVFFKATNQYGEDVTRANEFTVTISKGKFADYPTNKVTSSSGKLKVEAPNGMSYSLNEQVFFSVTYADIKGNFASDSKTLTVSPPAKVASVKFTELYNKDGKELTTATNLENDEFYILIEAYDQYGNRVTHNQLKSDTLLSNSAPHVVKVDLQGNGFTTINDGNLENALALQLEKPDEGLKAGTARVMIVSTTANSNDSFDVEVVQASRLESLTIGAPDVAPVGEKVEVPFEAYDQNGNEITNASKLRDDIDEDGFRVTGLSGAKMYFENDPETNKAKLYLDTTDVTTNLTQATPVVVSTTTKGQKFITATLTVSPKAKPVAIVKVDKVTSAVVKDGTTKIELKNISIEDQYGRTKPATFFVKTGTNYKITVSPDGPANAVTLSATELTSAVNTIDVTGGNVNGLTTLEFKVYDNTDEVKNSEYKLRIRTVGVDAIESYQTEVADLYAGVTAANASTYAQVIKITGVLSGGGTVAIPATDDYVSVTSGVYGIQVVADAAKKELKLQIDPTQVDELLPGSKTEDTFAIPFIGKVKNGSVSDVISVKVTKAAPVATKFTARDGTTNFTEAKRVSDLVISLPKAKVTNTLDLVQLVNEVVKVEDQYGKELINDFISASVASYSNSSAKELNDVEEGESFKIVAFTKNAKKFELTVHVK